jgi:hypothetical protein
MVWVQAFPTNTTLVSQSVGQIQANWLYLQGNIGTDHYFNTGNVNDGHHQFVQLPTIATPAPALNAVLYGQAVGSSGTYPFWNGAIQGNAQIPTAVTGSQAINSGVLTTVIPLGGTQFRSGLLTIYDTANSSSKALIMIVWTSVNPSASFVFSTAAYTATGFTGTNFQIQTNVTSTYRWNFYAIPN